MTAPFSRLTGADEQARASVEASTSWRISNSSRPNAKPQATNSPSRPHSSQGGSGNLSGAA